jgi:hypothetical protein
MSLGLGIYFTCVGDGIRGSLLDVTLPYRPLFICPHVVDAHHAADGAVGFAVRAIAGKPDGMGLEYGLAVVLVLLWLSLCCLVGVFMLVLGRYVTLAWCGIDGGDLAR